LRAVSATTGGHRVRISDDKRKLARARMAVGRGGSPRDCVFAIRERPKSGAVIAIVSPAATVTAPIETGALSESNSSIFVNRARAARKTTTSMRSATR
jgi:hypothetical protein